MSPPNLQFRTGLIWLHSKNSEYKSLMEVAIKNSERKKKIINLQNKNKEAMSAFKVLAGC